jgi:hypothetical protein
VADHTIGKVATGWSLNTFSLYAKRKFDRSHNFWVSCYREQIAEYNIWTQLNPWNTALVNKLIVHLVNIFTVVAVLIIVFITASQWTLF